MQSDFDKITDIFCKILSEGLARQIDNAICQHEKEIHMPLVKGDKAKSKKGFSTNVKREMEAGKPQAQSVAIAYSLASEKKKKKKK
jgi:hypothetical protein